MTAEELSALIKDEIGEDERLHAILDRIRDGKANLTDSELYAAITARITAQQMQRNVLSLEKREAAFVGITRERYTDTFTVFSAVQRILDAENGINIRPKEPGFDTGRARKIGHSLEDQTVPDSTIERRARSATENFCMSHHDDCMKVNAEFRARAGLQSYAIRDGSAKCCDWCADVSGKYPANETPAGFWGRHDNCKCSILYESKRSGRQLLRGAKDNTRRWEVVPENAGAEPLVRLTHEQAMTAGAGNPVVLTKEQAERLQAKHGLTILQETGIIKAITVDDVIKAGIKGEGTDSIIHEDVAKAIIDTITSAKKAGGKFDFDDVRLVSISPKEGEGLEVFRTNAVDRYGYPHVILEINEYAVGGLTKEQADLLFFMAENTACNSVEDGILHEIGHAKAIYGRTYANYERISDELEEKHIEGVSDLAEKDGLECIAECEVMLYHGAEIPEEARALYELYTSGGG